MQQEYLPGQAGALRKKLKAWNYIGAKSTHNAHHGAPAGGTRELTIALKQADILRGEIPKVVTRLTFHRSMVNSEREVE